MIPPHSNSSAEAPRVQFLGRKIDFVRELSLCFGDYVECWDKRGASNDTAVPRTHSCIALYPIGNDNISWLFFDIKSEEFITKSRWDYLPTPSVVVDAMTSISSRPDGGFARKSAIARQTAADSSTTPLVGDSDAPSTGVAATFDPVSPDVDPPSVAGVGDGNGNASDDDTPELAASDSDDWQEVMPRRAAALKGNEARARLVANRMLVAKKHKLVFHITVRQGIKTRGKDAVKSMKLELKSLMNKEAMHPVMLETLSKTQRKKILRSSMFLKEKFNSMGEF